MKCIFSGHLFASKYFTFEPLTSWSKGCCGGVIHHDCILFQSIKENTKTMSVMFCSANRSQLIEAMMVLATPLDYLRWWLLLAGKNLMIVPSSRWVGGWMVGLCRNQWILRWARRRVIITALAKRLPSGRGPPGSCWFLWGRVSALTLVRFPITPTLTLAIAHITTSASKCQWAG